MSLPPLLLLAGGRSSRMGHPKGLLEFNGQLWIDYHLSQFREAGGRAVVLVLGHQADIYLRDLHLSLNSNDHLRCGVNLRIVRNTRPERGAFSSLQSGLPHLDKTNGAFVLPIDVPPPKIETWMSLVPDSSANFYASIPEWNGKGGHPLWISSTLIELIKLRDPVQSRLDRLLYELPIDRLNRTPVDDFHVCLNFNEPSQWKTWKAMRSSVKIDP